MTASQSVTSVDNSVVSSTGKIWILDIPDFKKTAKKYEQ